MSVSREDAIARAQAELERGAFTPCDFARATLGEHESLGTGERRAEWTVVFVPKDERLRAMDPGELWIIVDAETGEARHQPLA